jgi:hypothetical protein
MPEQLVVDPADDVLDRLLDRLPALGRAVGELFELARGEGDVDFSDVDAGETLYRGTEGGARLGRAQTGGLL